MNFAADLNKLNFELGKYAGRLQEKRESQHSCSNLRYPFPPNIDCDACCHFVDRFLEREGLRTEFLVYGWDHIIDKMDEKFKEMEKAAYGRRNVGAGI